MSEQEESNLILERKSQNIQKDEEQNNLIEKDVFKNSKNSKNSEVQMKGNSLLNKIFILIGAITIFGLINYLFTQNKLYFKNFSYEIKQEVYCQNKTYYYLNQCLNQCPYNFIADANNNICLSFKFDKSQINILKLDKQTNFTQVEIFSSDFKLNALEDSFNDKQTGIVFFNDYINDDFSFLLQKVKANILQNFLSQINGAIFTFSGANLLYLQDEKKIDQQLKQLQDRFPQISTWYVLGLGFSGSFNGLKHFLSNLDMFEGIFVQDPIEDLGEIYDFKNILRYYESQIGSTLKQKQSIQDQLTQHFRDLYSKQIFIFKNALYKKIKTPILDKLDKNHVKIFSFYENVQNNQDSSIKYFTGNVFSIIEQQLSNHKKDLYNQIN